MSVIKLRPVIKELLLKLNQPDTFKIIPLVGGANNKIYRIDFKQIQYLLKIYFFHPKDTRDRLNTEFIFTTFFWQNGIRAIPQPFIKEKKWHLAIYEYIVGRQIQPQEVNTNYVNQMINFYLALNQFRGQPSAQALPTASEAYFTLLGHLQCIERRLDVLKTIITQTEIYRNTVKFIATQLKPKWMDVKEFVYQKAKEYRIGLTDEIPRVQRCISPSDFGLHNAILTSEGTLKFIDFEYAGWDEPAKFVCDMFCQPKIPIPIKYFNQVTQAVMKGTFLPKQYLNRIKLLFPVYQIKWCCIMLNDFLPVDSKRRSFASPAFQNKSYLSKQLNKAQKALKEVKL